MHFLIALLLSHAFSLQLGTYEPIEWPPPTYAIDWKNDCQNDVSVYAYSWGHDYHVVTLSPGESHEALGHLGHQYFAISPDNRFLGNFTVHWNPEIPPVTDGPGRHFLITCETTCATDQDSNTCLNNKKDTRVPRQITDDHLAVKQREHEKTRYNINKERTATIPRFTPVGFKTGIKMQDISPEAWPLILDFYEKSKNTETETLEPWGADNTYVNHQEVPITIMHLPHHIKQIIWRDLSIALCDWIGNDCDPKNLVGSSVYGIRRYWRGALLRNHADRVELVLSAIINVAVGKMEEPWPLEIFDHDKNPHIVMMKPGDVVFYESAACIHGRPLPMNGEYMANIFAHTKPIDWKLSDKKR